MFFYGFIRFLICIFYIDKGYDNFFFYIFQGKSNSSPVSADISVYILDNAAKNKKKHQIKPKQKLNKRKKSNNTSLTEIFKIKVGLRQSRLTNLHESHQICIHLQHFSPTISILKLKHVTFVMNTFFLFHNLFLIIRVFFKLHNTSIRKLINWAFIMYIILNSKLYFLNNTLNLLQKILFVCLEDTLPYRIILL